MTALEELVESRFTQIAVMKKANWLVYQQLLEKTAALLQSPVQTVQEVLLTLCVERGSNLSEALSCVHDFLSAYQSYQQHDSKEQEPAE